MLVSICQVVSSNRGLLFGGNQRPRTLRLRSVHGKMRDHQIRRLPVVNDDNELVGILTLNDLAVEAFGGKGGAASKRQREVGKTLAAVCEHHEFETTKSSG